MPKVKICGLCRPIDVDFVNAALPDYCGFIFVKKSKRYLKPAVAQGFKDMLNPKIKAVGVFQNENIGEIIAAAHFLDIIQLHGDEDENFILEVQKLTKLPVVKAFRATEAKKIKTAADFILLDTATKDGFGGTGLAFDWTKLPEMNRPWFLAGGISLENLDRALKTGAYCLDISSGVEVEGKKDKDKIIETVKRIREYDKRV